MTLEDALDGLLSVLFILVVIGFATFISLYISLYINPQTEKRKKEQQLRRHSRKRIGDGRRKVRNVGRKGARFRIGKGME